MTGPFKMKGSPMQRNFGIGTSPAKQTEEKPKSQEDVTLEKKKAGVGYETTVKRDEKTGKVVSTGRTFDDGTYVPD